MNHNDIIVEIIGMVIRIIVVISVIVTTYSLVEYI